MKNLLVLLACVLLAVSVEAHDTCRSADGCDAPTATLIAVGDHNWSTVTPDLSIGDADEGIISFGSAFIGQADETISGVVLDDVLFIVNPTDTASDLSFVLQSVSGVGRLMVPEEGDDLATWNPRSMVIGPAATAATLDEGIHCVDAASSLFTNIDCNTAATGADFGVQDDVEVLGTIYVGEALNTTGTVRGGVHVHLETDPTYTVGTDHAYEGYGGLFINNDNDAITFTLPPAVVGMSATFINGDGVTAVLTVDCDIGDEFVIVGVGGGGGNAIASTGAAGERTQVVATSAAQWTVVDSFGTWGVP